MSATARHYHARVPRYVLKAEDESLMRFAGMETRGLSTRARVRDLSEKGVAFVLSGAESPEEGDMLKIEFTIPGRSQIACFATVVRVDLIQEWDPDLGAREFKLVACQFRNLPTAYTRALSLGLKGRTKSETDLDSHTESNSKTDPNLKNSADWAQEKRAQTLTFSAYALSLVITLAWLATPASYWIHLVK